MSVLGPDAPVVSTTASIPSAPTTFTQEEKDSLISVAPIPIPPIAAAAVAAVTATAAAAGTVPVAPAPAINFPPGPSTAFSSNGASQATTVQVDVKNRTPSLPLNLASTTMPASRHASLASALPIPLGAATITSPSDPIPIVPDRFTLSDGTQIPMAGHGSMEKGWFFSATENARIVTVLAQAIRHGLRLIDTAKVYATEELVGRAVRESGVPREQLTIITKLWNTDHHRVKEAFEESLQKLHLDYIDIFIMHYPCALSNSPDGLTGDPLPPTSSPTLQETWSQMESLLQSNNSTCKSIGVSNFTQKTLTDLLSTCKIAPVVNEIEIHPLFPQKHLVPWCLERKIGVLAWAPLAGGPLSQYGEEFAAIYQNPTLATLAEKYHPHSSTAAAATTAISSQSSPPPLPLSPPTTTTTSTTTTTTSSTTPAAAATQKGNPADSIAKLLLSWLYSRSIIAIPHSCSVERIIENLRVVRMAEEDVALVNAWAEREGGGERMCLEKSPIWVDDDVDKDVRKCFGWTREEMGWVDAEGRVLV